MFRLAPSPLLAVVLPATALAAPIPKDPPNPAYYHPTRVGDRWDYLEPLDGVPFRCRMEVTAVQDRNGAKLVTAERRVLPRPSFRWFVVSDEGVLEADDDWNVTGVVLRLPARPGDSWADRATFPRVVSTVAGREEVEVPAGRFMAVKVDVATEAADGTTPLRTDWFAPGVGLVKSAGRGDVRVLRSFTPGKE